MIAIWEAIFKLRLFDSKLFPSALAVLSKLWEGFSSGLYPMALQSSLERVVIGYFLSIIFGISLGVLMGLVKFIDDGVGTMLLGIQSMGHAAWVPFAVLLFGENELAVIFIVQISAFITIALNTDSGIKFVQPALISQAKLYGLKGIRLFKEVILPAAIPSIITGIRLGWAFSWRGLVTAEILVSGLGIGHILMQAKNHNDMTFVLATMLLIAIISSLVDNLLFKNIERRIRRRWGLV